MSEVGINKRFTKKRLCEATDEYLSIDGVKSLAGFAQYLGISRWGLESLESDKRFAAIISFVKTAIEKDVVENGLRGKYNATMSSFILKTCFGYREKSEEKLPGAVRIEVADELSAYSE